MTESKSRPKPNPPLDLRRHRKSAIARRTHWASSSRSGSSSAQNAFRQTRARPWSSRSAASTAKRGGWQDAAPLLEFRFIDGPIERGGDSGQPEQHGARRDVRLQAGRLSNKRATVASVRRRKSSATAPPGRREMVSVNRQSFQEAIDRAVDGMRGTDMVLRIGWKRVGSPLNPGLGNVPTARHSRVARCSNSRQPSRRFARRGRRARTLRTALGGLLAPPRCSDQNEHGTNDSSKIRMAIVICTQMPKLPSVNLFGPPKDMRACRNPFRSRC